MGRLSGFEYERTLRKHPWCPPYNKYHIFNPLLNEYGRKAIDSIKGPVYTNVEIVESAVRDELYFMQKEIIYGRISLD